MNPLVGALGTWHLAMHLERILTTGSFIIIDPA
jgi:hypothetical protein